MSKELITAIEKGNLSQVKKLIVSNKALLDQPLDLIYRGYAKKYSIEDKNLTPLLYAAFRGKQTIVDYLIKQLETAGLNEPLGFFSWGRSGGIYAKTQHGATLLHAAAAGGLVKTIRYLLSKKIHVNEVFHITIKKEKPVSSGRCISQTYINKEKKPSRYGLQLQSVDTHAPCPSVERTVTITSKIGFTALSLAGENHHHKVTEILLKSSLETKEEPFTANLTLSITIPAAKEKDNDTPYYASGSRIETYVYETSTIISPYILAMSSVTEENADEIIDFFKQLKDQGAGHNISDELGNSLLHLAVEENISRLLNYLISESFNLNFLNIYRLTPVATAVHHRNLNALKLLLDSQSNHAAGINIRDLFHDTPLIAALDKEGPYDDDDYAIVRLLLKAGASTDMYAARAYSPLNQFVCAQLFSQRAEFYSPLSNYQYKAIHPFDMYPINIILRRENPDNMLALFCEYIDQACLKQREHWISLQDNERAFHQIHQDELPKFAGGTGKNSMSILNAFSAAFGRKTKVFSLLEIKTTPDLLATTEDVTPSTSMVPDSYYRRKFFDLLLHPRLGFELMSPREQREKEWEIESEKQKKRIKEECEEREKKEQARRRSERTTKLMNAIVDDDFNTFIERLDEDNVNTIDLKGNTALHYVMRYQRSINYLTTLLNHGANPNIKNKDGETPLLLACDADNLKINLVQYLLNHPLLSPSNINESDKYNRNALSNACFYNNLALVELLLEKGANIIDKDRYGETTLDLVNDNGCKFNEETTEITFILIKFGCPIDITKINPNMHQMHPPSLIAISSAKALFLIVNGQTEIPEEDDLIFLLDKGASLYQRDSHKRTIFHIIAHTIQHAQDDERREQLSDFADKQLVSKLDDDRAFLETQCDQGYSVQNVQDKKGYQEDIKYNPLENVSGLQGAHKEDYDRIRRLTTFFSRRIRPRDTSPGEQASERSSRKRARKAPTAKQTAVQRALARLS